MNDSTFISYFLPTSVLLPFLLFFSRNPNRNAPILVILLLWFFVFLLHGICVDFELLPVFKSDLVTNSNVCFALIALVLSFSVTRKLMDKFLKSARHYSNDITGSEVKIFFSYKIRFLLLIFSIVSVFLVYGKAAAIVNNTNVFSYLQLLRTNINYEGSSWGFTRSLGVPLIVISCYLMVLKKGSSIKEKIPEIIIVINTLLIAIISTQRTSILLLIIGLLFALSNNSLPRLKTIVLSSSLFVSMFILVGFFVGKVGDDTTVVNSVLLNGIESFAMYLLAPLSALAHSDILHHTHINGNYTLRFFFILLDKFGIHSHEYTSLIMDFVYVPYPTNVYTFLGAPVSDFGYFYFFYFMLIGIILGMVFSLPRGRISYRVLQGFAFYPIIMSVFQDQFLTLTSTWIQIFITIFLLRILEKRTAY
ncbi:MAG: hypothetical protein CMF29_07825 [Kiritimatiellaceae bacterium]|nr:hypothetical protein [Kiritimatiellaceae bacterium]